MERKWRKHVECILRKDICMRRSKAVISTCVQGSPLPNGSARLSSVRLTAARTSKLQFTSINGVAHADAEAVAVGNGLAFGAGAQPTLQMLAPPSTHTHSYNNG